MTDPGQPSYWTTYIISTLATVVGSMITAILFLAKLIESKYVTEIKDLKMCLTNLETKYDKKLDEQEVKLADQKQETDNCQTERQELAVKVARLESESDNLRRLAQSSEMRSMGRADLLKEQIKGLESKIEKH